MKFDFQHPGPPSYPVRYFGKFSGTSETKTGPGVQWGRLAALTLFDIAQKRKNAVGNPIVDNRSDPRKDEPPAGNRAGTSLPFGETSRIFMKKEMPQNMNISDVRYLGKFGGIF